MSQASLSGEQNGNYDDVDHRYFLCLQAVHRAEEEKKTILTELGHASLELEKGKSSLQKHVGPPTDKDTPDSTPARSIS